MATPDGAHPPPTLEAVFYLIHHIILPEKLPQQFDYDAAHERTLLQVVVESLRDLQNAVEPGHVDKVMFALSTISNLICSRNNEGDAVEEQIKCVLDRISKDVSTGALPIEVKAQNAGLLVHGKRDAVMFQFFELSPTNEAVMKTLGRLQRTFPGSACEVAMDKMRDENLTTSLARTISKMTCQATPESQPQITKNGQSHDESRDGTHPRAVTDLLMNYITALGKPASAAHVTKNTRQEILWDGGVLAWKRSPLWLLTRVSLQLIMNSTNDSVESPEGLYKSFMVILVSKILDLAQMHAHELGHDLVHAVRAKLRQRLGKMGRQGQVEVLKPDYLERIAANEQQAYELLKKSWESIISSTSVRIDTAALASMQPLDHLDLDLSGVDTFLSRKLARESNIQNRSLDAGDVFPALPAADLPVNLNLVKDERLWVHLLAFEKWVHRHLTDWIESNKSNKTTCNRLEKAISQYFPKASEAYEGAPESTSIMFLTVLELWKACDTVACVQYPLLKNCDPEIRLSEFQCLSLHLRQHMKRLDAVERYVLRRRNEASPTAPSVVSDFGHEDSFAVKYYNRSDTLKTVKAKVEQIATAAREAKCRELTEKQSDYDKLMQRYAESKCDFLAIEPYLGQFQGEPLHEPHALPLHSTSCHRCALKQCAEDLRIEPHEWPLSSNPSKAKATVFELRIPKAFNAWRNSTMYVLFDILSFQGDMENVIGEQFTLENHDVLKDFLPSSAYERQRLVLMSVVKPVMGTHYKDLSTINNYTEANVCVDNALKYRYYDRFRETFVKRPFAASDNISKKCTYRMPKRSHALGKYLLKPPSQPDGVSPNTVLANVADCPAHFSADEFQASSALALGRNIVYFNILAQLAMPTLDFTKVETQIIIQQAVHQCGIRAEDRVERATHQVLSGAEFCAALLRALRTSLQKYAQNWDSWRALATLVVLARRMITLATVSDVRLDGLAFLVEVRKVCFRWLTRLNERCRISSDCEQRKDLQSRQAEVAFLCCSTFDVQEELFTDILKQHSASAVFLQCSITVQVHHSLISETEPLYIAMMQAWRSLAFRIFPTLQTRVLANGADLDKTVSGCWSDFRQSSGWTATEEPHNHWLQTRSGDRFVQFNLLTAQLLVDGLPLTRLPKAYSAHAVCRSLFKQSEVDVGPSNEPGMRFSSVHKHHGFDLHFGMTVSDGTAGNDVILIAKNQESKYALLPPVLFKDHLPDAFTTKYHHWYDQNSHDIILKPLDQGWPLNLTDAEWRLNRNRGFWRLTKATSVVVSPKSPYACAASKLFTSLEERSHVHTMYDMASKVVTISLPRLRLDFETDLSDSDVRSCQYRDHVLDHEQDAGTLIGLTSKIILRHRQCSKDRMILIPEGCVKHQMDTTLKHVNVAIERGTVKKVHAYALDVDLGRITDIGDFQGKIVLALMHALTSNCLCDPLTGRTGTESALAILRSAAVLSFEKLTAANMELLDAIASLSPRREFWPRGLVGVQKISWDSNLPFMSQHGALLASVNTIYEHASRTKIFYHSTNFVEQRKESKEWMTDSEQLKLTRRNAIRTSSFRVLGFGAEDFTTDEDAVYESRDQSSNTPEGCRAFRTATMMFRNSASLYCEVQKLDLTFFKAGGKVLGATGTIDTTALCYDSKCLDDPSKIIAEAWLDLHHFLPTSCAQLNSFDITIWLSAMAFAETANMALIQTLGAFYRIPQLASVALPTGSLFHIQDSYATTSRRVRLEQIARHAKQDMANRPESRLPKRATEIEREYAQRSKALFKSNTNEAIREFAESILPHWASPNVACPAETRFSSYICMPSAMEEVKSLFTRLHDNYRFKQYLNQVSEVLSRQEILPVSIPSRHPRSLKPKQRPRGVERYVSLCGTTEKAPTALSKVRKQNPDQPDVHIPAIPSTPNDTRVFQKLDELEQELRLAARTEIERGYVAELKSSIAKLRTNRGKAPPYNGSLDTSTQEALQNHLDECEQFVEAFNLALLQFATGTQAASAQLAFSTELSPRISPTFWLSYLNPDRFKELHTSWREIIVSYGLAIVQLKRARRMCLLVSRPADLAEELDNVGHENWNPLEHPEILLMEAEGGIVIRAEQEEVAYNMRQPSNGKNTVIQFPMGKGKSSVVVPMLVAALADKDRLIRVIATKAQSKQMARMLVARLGGLLNRRIYFMPISRNSRPSAADAQSIRQMLEECRTNRGVLLVHPEHILSFRNMAIESRVAGKDQAESLLTTQAFLDAHSRDIIDECDEALSVKVQLDYTIGSPRLLEGGSDRWNLIQTVLDLVPAIMAKIETEYPLSVQVRLGRSGSFPQVRILRDDIVPRLHELMAHHITEYGLAGLPIRNQTASMRQAISNYITQAEVNTDDVIQVANSLHWTKTSRRLLFVARGLLAGGLLAAALSKRWRVEYGLDLTRHPKTMTAVPFRSKDTPTQMSEFAHPDMRILLTYLSYYYTSLDDRQLIDAFEHLLKSDQVDTQYSEWVSTADPSLPVEYRSLSGISLKDRVTCEAQIFPNLRFSRGAIHYYLSNLVFPKEMKVHPQKLSGSGWDIGMAKVHPTAAFSGTDDTKSLAPLDMRRNNLASQLHVNAEVLSHLLRDSTMVETLPRRTSSEVSDAEHLLQILTQSNITPVQAVFDVGAQVLDLNNAVFARLWLEQYSGEDIQAIVYFESEEIMVLDRSGCIEPLQASPYARQLQHCLVYLDEAHTRGTDLKLPRIFRAAVTLGPNLVKDALTQACMRLRKLGQGQSVTFFVNEEIATKIQETSKKGTSGQIRVQEILTWSIRNTWSQISRDVGIWAVQGKRHETRKHLFYGAATTKEQACSFLEDEDQDVESRYRPRMDDERLLEWDVTNQRIADIISQLQRHGLKALDDTGMNEEQERELNVETQQERQVQRQPRMQPEPHKIHADVATLVVKGKLDKTSPAFKPAFQLLNDTSAAQLIRLQALPADVYVTVDFMRTVKRPAGVAEEAFVSDPFLRQTQFIISVPGPSSTIQNLVIISPYEANELLGDIRANNKVTLHLYAACHNATYKPLDKLKLYNVGRTFDANDLSSDLRLQLNLFAGSLYVRSQDEYAELCNALGLLKESATADQQVSADGFITSHAGKWKLKESPVPFLRQLLLKIRREGEGVEKTHLGKILNGLRLEHEDFEINGMSNETLRRITPEVSAEFEHHTQALRSRSRSPEQNSGGLFVAE